MFSERIQILISPEQRSWLEEMARQRDTSVAALVREALDAHFHIPTREERMAAAKWLTSSTAGGKHMPIEELNELIDSRFDDEMERIEAQRQRL